MRSDEAKVKAFGFQKIKLAFDNFDNLIDLIT